MTDTPENIPLVALSEFATEAHTRIQQDFAEIDPIVGVSHNMRNEGIPADLMTIDCLKTNKRIIIVLHDQMPGLLSYQFSYRNQDPGQEFQQMLLTEMSADMLYGWIQQYFGESTPEFENH